jgi:hypothetical protein
MDREPAADTPDGMIRDLRTILDGWAYEPGKISVRKIIAHDGREKIQTRIDLGVMQIEPIGRPDGLRPHDCESLLVYHEQQLRKHIEVYGSDEDFVLSPEDCRDLRHEAYLYYQRYLSQFVLEEYEAVERDTSRNLRVIALCRKYGASSRDREILLPQQPYVFMMCARAKALHVLARGQPAAALRIVERAMEELRRMPTADDEECSCVSELNTLSELRREVLEKLPDNSPARLQSLLERALAEEDYERAAELRDRLARRRERKG